jgi:hypothetical protein
MADPVLGELYAPYSYLPKFVQEGGAGTPVVPPPAEYLVNCGSLQIGNPPVARDPLNQINGQWNSGCGHVINSWEVRQDTVDGVLSAIVCCPLCGFVQQIITPYSLFLAEGSYLFA